MKFSLNNLLSPRSFINSFNKSIFEQDYFSAFTLASILLKTSSKMIPNNTFIAFDTSVRNITRNEIKSFLKATDDSWIQPATALLKHIKILADEISLPEDILDVSNKSITHNCDIYEHGL